MQKPEDRTYAVIKIDVEDGTAEVYSQKGKGWGHEPIRVPGKPLEEDSLTGKKLAKLIPEYTIMFTGDPGSKGRCIWIKVGNSGYWVCT